MKVNQATLHKIAELARLEFNPEDEAKLLGDLNKILEWVELLEEVDTTEVEPLIHISNEINVFREDEVKNQLEHSKGLFNAPKKDQDYFRVPKVIE